MRHFPGGKIPTGTLRFIPEWVVEVQSPNDEVEEVEARIEDYLDNGCKLVWLVMPGRRAIRPRAIARRGGRPCVERGPHDHLPPPPPRT